MGGVNPLAFAAFGAGQQPELWGPMLDQMGIPLPNTPQFAQMVMPQQQPDIGGMLTAGPNPTGPSGIVGPAFDPNAVPPPAEPVVPPAAAAVPPPAAAPPPAAVTPPGARPPVLPQVKMPEQPKPIMSGGVANAQKAPDMKMAASTGGTPAQMLMAALLGGGPGGGLDPLRVPALGQLLRGNR